MSAAGNSNRKRATVALVVAVVAGLAWYAWTPDRVRVRIVDAPQALGPFRVDVSLVTSGFHASQTDRLAVAMVPGERIVDVPARLGVVSRLGRVNVRAIHPEYRWTLAGRGNYRGQIIELRPVAWADVLAREPDTEFKVPPIGARTDAYLQSVSNGEVLRLSDVHYHLWSIREEYLSAFSDANDRAALHRSTRLLERLLAYVETQRDTVTARGESAGKIEEMRLWLNEIEASVQ